MHAVESTMTFEIFQWRLSLLFKAIKSYNEQSDYIQEPSAIKLSRHLLDEKRYSKSESNL